MALTPEEQKLLDFALGSLPTWFREQLREFEFTGGSATLVRDAQEALEYWFSQALITTAVGATGSDPDWLNQHAADRGTSRQDGESDAELRSRLRTFSDALTLPVMLEAVQDIAGVGAAIVEASYNRSFMHDWTADTGTGGVFSGTAPNMEFTPDTPFQNGVANLATSGFFVPRLANGDITFAGSNSAGNDGTFTITGVDGNKVLYTNGSGVAETDGGTGWTHTKRDSSSNNNIMDGFAATYLSRGHRLLDPPPPHKLIVILPFGCTAGTVSSVQEAMRQKKGAGLVITVECRQNP